MRVFVCVCVGDVCWRRRDLLLRERWSGEGVDRWYTAECARGCGVGGWGYALCDDESAGFYSGDTSFGGCTGRTERLLDDPPVPDGVLRLLVCASSCQSTTETTYKYTCTQVTLKPDMCSVGGSYTEY